MKIGLFFQVITFITEFRGSNILLPTFLAGSKWDFPVANLLLATVSFEPWKYGTCSFSLMSSLLLKERFKTFTLYLNSETISKIYD